MAALEVIACGTFSGTMRFRISMKFSLRSPAAALTERPSFAFSPGRITFTSTCPTRIAIRLVET